MESSQIFNKILELARENSKQEDLRNFCKANIEKILLDFPRRVLRNDGGNLIDCIFKGLPDNKSLVKVKVIDKVLKTGREEPMSLTHCGDVISKVCLELPRMPVEHLIRWSSECVQSIVEDGDVNMIWKDILPECLNSVSTHNLVKHCGSEMTGEEFKIQCVHTLCQCRWTEKQLVQLAAMFKDLQLPKVEHKQVVNKICSYIVDLPPDTLPPLVHQLLKLCKLYNTEVVLSHLSHYFNIRLYSKLEPPPQDSESTTIDMDEIVQYSHAELSRCLSTCLYHISQGVAEPELIRKHIKQWPKTQLLRAPFIIDLALAVSDKGTDFKSVCMDIIRSAIELNILDKLRSNESSWVRSVLPPEVDVANVLKVLTTESANHRQLTVLGLINLAFSLLSVSRIKPTASLCWSHGKLILVRLSKAQPETAGHILGQLADRLFSDQNLPQYTDCLYVLCKLTPVSVERCSQLITILENCQPLGSYLHSANTYEAVRPLIAFSTRVRDVLVMVCRKGLYSRDSAYRCLALSGFLTVLRHIKLSKTLLMSQTNYSDDCSEHSYLTQIAVDMHSNSQGSTVTSRMRNETICLEVVFILRRCLVQDATVKQLLYTEMYDCAKEKPALHESILELFYEHLVKYLQEEEENWGLLLDKCVQETPITANLIEPIGRLLYVIAQFLQPIPEDTEELSATQSDNSSAYLKTKLMEIMNKLCKTDLLSLINMEDVALTDLSPESKAKSLKIQQLMQCFEALIAHQVLQWNPTSTLAESVHKLYKHHTQLLDNTKTSPKTKKTLSFNQTKEDNKNKKTAKKGKNPKANNKNKPVTDSQETTISQTTQEENKTPGNKRTLTQKSEKSQKSPKKNKMSNLVKDRAGPFKPLSCLWDMRLCLRILELLYSEEVPWSSTEQRNYIRSKCDFHLYVIRNIQSIMGEKLEKKVVVTQVMRVAELLYKRCVCRFQDICDFDERTTLACLELFKTSLNLLLSPNYSLKIESVLSGITSITDKPESASLADMLVNLHNILTHLEKEAAEEDLDLIRKKILATVIQIACVLLETPVVACTVLNEVILKLEEYVQSSKQAESLQLLAALLTAAQRQQREATLLGQVLDKLTVELGFIDEEETAPEESSNFPTIDSRSGHSVLSHVCLHLSNRFKCAEHLLNRARDLANALLNAVHTHQQRIDTELKELYKSIIIELCQLSTWTSQIASLRCSVGAGSDKVLGTCVRLYVLLGMLVKQIDPDTAVVLRLDRLVKFSGKKLSSIIDSLITYMESSQDQQKASKVLRDTKLIPRLVLEAEQFSKHVLLLGSKAKINFKQYLSIGTARDFKIKKAPVLEEFLNNGDEIEQESEDEIAEDAREAGEENDANNDVNINDAATEIISPVMSDRENDESDDEPPIIIKRKRRS